MDVLSYLVTRFGVDLAQRQQPIEIPNTNRETLAQIFHAVGFTVGAEIGVERAMYSEVLARSNPGVTLHLVDAWQAYRGYRDHVNQRKLDGFYKEAITRMSHFPNIRFRRQFSVDAAADLSNGSLDFVYIDGNHRLESVISDLAAWAPKVRAGGIIAGHDYLKCQLPSLMHVPQAIHAWINAYQIAPLFVLGRKAKVPGELRDDGRSWFYVQPEPVKLEGKIKQ